MSFGLRVAHRLLLIYLLSFVSVVYLAYSLVAEKNITIEFARKELRGSAYVAVVRDAVLAIGEDRAALSPQLGTPIAGDIALPERLDALVAAERKYGDAMGTGPLASQFATVLKRLIEQKRTDLVARRSLQAQAMRSARQLIARIGDQSNLILDPDLDSYYMMSVVMLRLPETVTTAIDLADAAAPVNAKSADDENPQVGFQLAEAALLSENRALIADITAGYSGNPDGQLYRNLNPSFLRAQSAIGDFSRSLREMVINRRSADANPIAVRAMLRRVLATSGEFWQQAETELEHLLRERVDRLYRRMAVDLGSAALVSLVAFCLILLIARQITRPIRKLAAVAERVRYGQDYSLRARVRSGGEIGSLVDGFNTMLDRLQGEAEREQERVARDRAEAAQRQLLESMPIAISVVSEVDERLLYANTGLPDLLALPKGLEGNPRDMLTLVYPEDRATFLEEFRRTRHVDGFEARCRTANGEPFWILIGSRAVDYQGEPARLNVYTPINDRKRAEADLARRSAVLDAIGYAATRIIGATDWRPGMQELLARLGIATDVSRVFLFEIHAAPDGKGLAQSCRFGWTAPGLESIFDDTRYQNDPISDDDDPQFVEWFRRRRAGEVIQVTLRETQDAARKLFEETHTFSMLSVPIFVGGAFWGTLGFDDCKAERVWNEMEIEALKTAAVLVAGALERARADEALRERESELIEAQRIAHVGSWELDFDTNEVNWSDEGWRIFGLEPDHRAWTHAENLQRIHPDDRARVGQADAVAREHGGAFDTEYRIVRPDGEVRMVHERAETVYDSNDRPVRLIGTIHDVTELKATEAKLRESEERYELAVRGADAGLWDWDVVKDRAYFAPRLHEILGVSKQALGTSIIDLFDQLVPEDRDALQRHLNSRFAIQRRRFELDVRMQTVPDDIRWLQIRGLIVYGKNGPVRIVGSIRDITDRKRAQEELIRQREALYQSEKMAMFGSLLAGVAHELNNPLSVVIGQLGLLQRKATDSAVVNRAERIRNAADRCARIVRTFLAMARQRQPDPKPITLNALVEAALDLLAYQIRSGGIRVDLALAQDLPAVTVDPDQLHQVVTNLIVNASHALSAIAGKRILRISTRYDVTKLCVCLAVADNGSGVPAEIRTRIFDPFFTTKPLGEGTGIGLSLCASIIRSYGGKISVGDTPGGGATFTIALPVRATAVPQHNGSQDETTLVGLRILIADDELGIAQTLGEILQVQGHEPEMVSDGQAALDRVLVGEYDLILSDLRMPVLDGAGLHRGLRQRRPDMVSRLAFITGDTLSPENQSFLAESGALCLEKPFQPEDVLRLVSQVMRRNE
jgi:PAS domain S-box-containing protein